MKNLDDIADAIEREMDEKDAVRELALKSSRAVIRLAGSVIRGIHRKEDTDKMMEEMRDELMKMLSILDGHPDLYHSGFVENAFIEYSEANIVAAVVKNLPFPTPAQLHVTSSAYLLGMGDAVGEFRRLALNALRDHGDAASAMEYLHIMEAIHNMLMRFDYPEALLSVRRQQDISRSLVEKTSSEITLSVRTLELEHKLNHMIQHIGFGDRKGTGNRTGKTPAKPAHVRKRKKT